MPDLGPPIAIGRTAEVFAWGDGRILKLVRPGMPTQLGEIEARAARAVTAAGIAAPRLIETVRVDGRFGLVYERVAGRSMLDAFSSQPLGIGRRGHEFAVLHASMHDASGAGLPDLKDYLRRQIDFADLPEDVRAAALDRLSRLPDGGAILHGDMHPSNVVMTPGGPIVIDWMTAARGDPAADVCRTLFLLRESAVPGPPPLTQRLAIAMVRRWFTRSYVRAYRSLRPFDPAAVAAWRPVIVAARLGEHIQPERERLIAELRRPVVR
jgi:Ser/Thr protein kinase RdoA (MazF antagonist)